jgi:ParB family chromosome partitioning protein
MISKLIPLDDIKVDPEQNPRKEVDEKAIAELEESIKSVYEMSGTHKTLLQPIVVRECKDPNYPYELRFGYRRFIAMKNLWASNPKDRPWAGKIPAMVDDHDREDEDRFSPLAFALIENVQRADMSPIDEALAIKAMVDDHKLQQKDIATLLGKSKGWVSQRLKLTQLAHEVRTALAEGKIGHAAARQLSKLEDQETQAELLKQGLKENWQEEDWTREANLERRKERGENNGNDDDGGQPKEKPEPTTEPTPSSGSGLGYSVQRQPSEIKKAQETAEVDGNETDYEAGVSDALLWVLGLGPNPLTGEASEADIDQEDD